ncbi:hypothetical protein [Streptomyces sp. NPDC101234]|uniref:hypothetical protein n=1 Tax=Streptomyces sp. NPDC101234 TaxID=3366138 RepID=UPI00382DA230
MAATAGACGAVLAARAEGFAAGAELGGLGAAVTGAAVGVASKGGAVIAGEVGIATAGAAAVTEGAESVTASKDSIDADLGPYDGIYNNCVTYFVDILRAGGVDIPAGANGMVRTKRMLERIPVPEEENPNKILAEIIVSKKVGGLHLRRVGETLACP